MSPVGKLVSAEDSSGAIVRRKRLGQYFTGTSLGRVLAALARAEKATSVIDPMSGKGDLLVACIELGADPSDMGALEIDPVALKSCMQRLPQATCVLGSAFDPKSLVKLPRLQWDLVITNPPYVRYQSISKSTLKDVPLPGAVEIRNGLLSEIMMLPGLDKVDKDLFRRLAKGYSGLADLAVPSWILCAGLVAPGGRLALVVPESWLSRNYAAVVHYMLLRWFEIEFVVEDEHAAWFADAQVKTTLLVARRVPRRQGAFDFPKEESFLRIAVSGKASGPGGPCSRLWQGKRNPEKSFAVEARKWLSSGARYEDEMVRTFVVSLARVASNLRGVCAKQKWFPTMTEAMGDAGAVLPHELEEWLNRSPTASSPVSLTSLGVQAGQGLRTGANAFFYGEKVGDGSLVFEKLFSTKKWVVPDEIALPVVRKQNDLPVGFLVSAETTPGRVLDLRRHALPEDIRSGGNFAATAYAVMPESLADLVREVELADFGDNGVTKSIWQLSAVAPNVRKGRIDEGKPPKFWYMLPDFTRRHKPDILIARINTGRPRAYLNKDSECIIDANFVTLWTDRGSGPDKYALLALLNSAWVATALEYSASVMGGGALKVEATHLRRLPVPPMDAKVLLQLVALGKKLSRATGDGKISGLFEKIDDLVASAALGRKASNDDVNLLRALAEAGRSKRENHKSIKAKEILE